MTRLFFTLLTVFSFLVTVAGQEVKPEPIYSITRVQQDLDYYQQQYRAWELVLDKEPTAPSAWFNYYSAARAANILGANPRYDLDAIITKMKNNLPPDTFEYHYLQVWNGGLGSPDFGKHLESALELAPDRWETYSYAVSYYMTQGDTDRATEFCRRWLDSGEVSPGLLAWNYNMLQSVEPNAILLTNGDNDTYPAWLLQHGREVRPDVAVLNLHLLRLPDYRERVFRELGITEKVDVSVTADGRTHLSAMAKHLAEYARRPLYFGITTAPFLRERYEDQLYLTGLALKYSTDPFDNLKMLEDNYENKFLTDDLRMPLSRDISESVVSQMNMNYIPPLLTLYRHYEKTEEHTKAKALRNLITRIAERAGRAEEVKQYFLPDKSSGFNFQPVIKSRVIDKMMVPVSEGLYAAVTEIPLSDYRQFLESLQENQAFDLLEVARINPVDWKSLLPQSLRSLPDRMLFFHDHPDQANCPVQNISQEAARLYCDWLTKAYNHSDDRRKQFKKVRFRLPTAEEWTHAARGDTPCFYPWGGHHPQNARGCYLSNFDVTEAAPCEECPSEARQIANDGGFFPVNVTAYFSNNLGLFNTSGNVAEMVQESGVAMGGSWADPPERCQVDSRQSFDGPSPAIGFRVFMEVLEE